MNLGTELKFGEDLRRERIERKITLEDLTAATKISARLLKALEDSDLSRLPAPVFTRGFIRSYASHIGIDPEETIRAYLAYLANKSAGTTPSASPARSRLWRRRGATAGTIVGGVTAVLLILGLIARPERRPAPRFEKSSSRARVELKNVGVSSEPTPEVRQDGAAAAPAPEVDQRDSVLLEFDADSWTKLDAEGETLLVGMVRRGATKRFEACGGFRLSLGNAGGVRVTVDGRALESLGATGQVILDLPLPAPSARG